MEFKNLQIGRMVIIDQGWLFLPVTQPRALLARLCDFSLAVSFHFPSLRDGTSLVEQGCRCILFFHTLGYEFCDPGNLGITGPLSWNAGEKGSRRDYICLIFGRHQPLRVSSDMRTEQVVDVGRMDGLLGESLLDRLYMRWDLLPTTTQSRAEYSSHDDKSLRPSPKLCPVRVPSPSPTSSASALASQSPRERNSSIQPHRRASHLLGAKHHTTEPQPTEHTTKHQRLAPHFPPSSLDGTSSPHIQTVAPTMGPAMQYVH
jgi:hypothetical protein